MSRMTCLSIVSGFSARSSNSFRLAFTSVATRSSSAMINLLRASVLLVAVRRAVFVGCYVIIGRCRPIADGPDLSEHVRHLHARQRLEQCRDLRRHLCDVAGDLMHAG